MNEQIGSDGEPCPTPFALSLAALVDDRGVIAHVGSCSSCARYQAEIIALHGLLQSAGLAICDVEYNGSLSWGDDGAPRVRQPGGHWLRPSVRLAGIAVIVACGLAILFGDRVVPISPPREGTSRGAALQVIEATARWDTVERALEISWLGRAGDDLFVVRVWRSDGLSLAKASTPGERVRFDANDWPGNPGLLLWSVDAWAKGQQVATSKLREIAAYEER